MTTFFKDHLTQLIATPSVSCVDAQVDQSNRPMIDLLANWFSDAGFAIDIMPTDDPIKFNLIATLGQGANGLVLAGHTDTVPFDLHKWQTNPFTLTEKDNRFYGLGTCDMKSFFAIALQAFQQFKGKTPKQPLIILATADEESSMRGARVLTEMGKPLARYAVIGEPTDLKPIRMHKGIMQEKIIVEGKAGHASNPALGNNAIEAMHAVVSELFNFRTQLETRFIDHQFTIATPTLNLGCIHGGDSPNRICGACELLIDIRTLPTMQQDAVRLELRERLTTIAKARGVICRVESLFPGLEAFCTPSDSALVSVCEKLTGITAQSVAFGTEAPFLQKMGMDTIVMGAGSINQAHQPDEYIDINAIDPMVKILQNLIAQFCYDA